VQVFTGSRIHICEKILPAILTVATVIDHDGLEMASIRIQRPCPKARFSNKHQANMSILSPHRRLYVNRCSSILIAAFLTFGLTAPAIGTEICGLEATGADGGMMVQAGRFSAACIPNGKCSINLSNVDNVGIALERASVAGSWLALVTSSSSIDSGAGFDLVFDEEDETRIAPDFLIAAEDMKSVRVDDDVSDIVISTMFASKTMSATIQLVGGKKIIHNIALGDLGKATEWVDCAQGK